MTSTRHNGYATRALREAREMTVQDLCNKLTSRGRELSAPALRNIELEHRDAKPELIDLIAEILEVPVLALRRGPLTTRHNGYAIRSLREARGLSVQDLCNDLTTAGRDLSAPALRNIELEHREAKLDLVQRIAKVLEVPVLALTRAPLTSWAAPRKDERVPA